MKWWIPGNVPSSKNSRRWTGKYFIASKTVMNYRKLTDKDYKKHAASFTKELSKYQLPVYVHFTFVRGTRHKFDYINPCQTVQDDMVKHKWIEDDNCEYIIPCFEKYTYNKKNPGVLIEIKEENNVRKE
tara:strand:- start:618 stop:1004 length:387 start_codon:yes stop_codon:yes gene_type:complete